MKKIIMTFIFIIGYLLTLFSCEESFDFSITPAYFYMQYDASGKGTYECPVCHSHFWKRRIVSDIEPIFNSSSAVASHHDISNKELKMWRDEIENRDWCMDVDTWDWNYHIQGK